MFDILYLFMIYSIIGWLWETPYVSIRFKKYTNRGFLNGPYIPIYGFGAITIILSMNYFSEHFQFNNFLMVIVAMIYISIVCSIWEYLVSWGMELIFKTRWWDYSDRKFNLNGRIALDYSIGWGIGGYILWNFINSRVVALKDIIPTDIFNISLAVFYTVFLIDSVITIKQLMTFRTIMIKLNNITNNVKDKVVFTYDSLNKDILHIKKEKLEKLQIKKDSLYNKILLLKEKADSNLDDKQKQNVYLYNKLLERTNKVSRFIKHYPKAYSKKISNSLDIIRIKINEKN